MSLPITDNLRGALFMTASMAGFAFNDAVMKNVLSTLPLMPAVAIRGAFMVLAIAALCAATGVLRWRPGRRDGWLLFWRTVGELGSTIGFLTALSHMPLASATAILQSAPLAVTLAAVVFLREPVGWRRGLALAVGFLGVMLIIRPGTDSFNAFALSALAAVLFIVLRDMVTRYLSPGAPSLMVSLTTAIAITTIAAVASLREPLPPVDAPMVGLLAIAAGFLIIGYVFAVRTMRVGEVGFIAPFRYTILLFALISGAVFFGEVPDAAALLGAALVVGSGLFTFWRENRIARAGAAAP